MLRKMRKWKRNRKQVKNEGEYTPWIHLKDVHDKTRVYEYKLEGCMVVGRDPHLCDVAIVEEPTVSGRQCRLYTEENEVYLMDLDGTNPTYHNNVKVVEDVTLRSGDVISFGEMDFYVEIK